MGVYYYFYNVSRNNEQNKHILNGQLCEFVTKFDYYSEEEQRKIFEKCIRLNEWNKYDILLAVPDYSNHDVFIYENGMIELNNSLKDIFFDSLI